MAKKTQGKSSVLGSTFFYKAFCLLMLVLSLAQPLNLVYQHRENFFNKGYEKQYEGYKKAYYSSQYVKKKNPGIIPDETFEAFAGGAFLKGMNPILIVHDHPPLGRYIISLSIFLFDNPHTILLPLLAFSILGIFLIGRLVIGHTLLALIPLIIFMNEPIFLSKIAITPLPEPVNLPFIIFSIYFFMKSIRSKNPLPWYIFTALMLGFVISIRFFVLGATLVAAMGLFLLLRQRTIERVAKFVLSLFLAPIVLFLSYTRTMLDGYSPIEILGVQKYILEYHKSLFILPFSYWDLLLFNRWHTWWGDRAIITDSSWVISWPASVITTLSYALFTLIKRIKISDYEFVLLLWVILYSILLSTGYTSSRYFLPVIPFFYILAVSFGKNLYLMFAKRK